MDSTEQSEEEPEYIHLRKVPGIIKKLTGSKPHISTIHRWHQRGINGVRLETVHIGQGRYTTMQWLHDFFTYSGGEQTDQQPQLQPSLSLDLRIARATANLKRHGVA